MTRTTRILSIATALALAAALTVAGSPAQAAQSTGTIAKGVQAAGWSANSMAFTASQCNPTVAGGPLNGTDSYIFPVNITSARNISVTASPMASPPQSNLLSGLHVRAFNASCVGLGTPTITSAQSTSKSVPAGTRWIVVESINGVNVAVTLNW